MCFENIPRTFDALCRYKVLRSAFVCNVSLENCKTELQPVPYVDLSRYTGSWYDVVLSVGFQRFKLKVLIGAYPCTRVHPIAYTKAAHLRPILGNRENARNMSRDEDALNQTSTIRTRIFVRVACICPLQSIKYVIQHHSAPSAPLFDGPSPDATTSMFTLNPLENSHKILVTRTASKNETQQASVF